MRRAASYRWDGQVVQTPVVVTDWLGCTSVLRLEVLLVKQRTHKSISEWNTYSRDNKAVQHRFLPSTTAISESTPPLFLILLPYYSELLRHEQTGTSLAGRLSLGTRSSLFAHPPTLPLSTSRIVYLITLCVLDRASSATVRSLSPFAPLT